jgi:hypothetical protein
VLRGIKPTENSEEVQPGTEYCSKKIEDIVFKAKKSTDSTTDIEADEYTMQAIKMPVNTWIKFIDDNQQYTQAKLSWISKATGNYTFVNKQGIKLSEMTLPGLACLLRRESTAILEDIPLMDRALASMMTSLRGNSTA